MSTELAVKNVSDFAIFNAGDITELQDIMQENFGDGSLNANQLAKIKVPSGGGTTFSIPTLEGEVETKEIEGVILIVKPYRVYWASDFDGSGTPPDCKADDALNGFGDPGGFCPQCPLAKFDESIGGSPCDERRNIFLLPSNMILPYVLSVPFMSIKALQGYQRDLTAIMLSLNRTTTKISLQKCKNKKGIDYSELRFAPGTKLNKEQQEMIKGYKQSFQGLIEATHSEAAAGGNGGFTEDAPDFDEA